MAANTQRNDIIMNPNATYPTDAKQAMNSVRAAAGLLEPRPASPIRASLDSLYGSISAAQKTQQNLETQLTAVLGSYPVNPMSDVQSIDTNSPAVETTGCSLSDEIYALVRMVNSLVDRQESMSRHVQL